MIDTWVLEFYGISKVFIRRKCPWKGKKINTVKLWDFIFRTVDGKLLSEILKIKTVYGFILINYKYHIK